MAAILVYATVKGCQKYHSKKSKFSSGYKNKLSKNRESISRLVIPSLASATIIPGGEEPLEKTQPPQIHKSSDKIGSTPPVRLGLTLCESPITPPDELDEQFLSDPQKRNQDELQLGCPLYRLSQAFDQAGEENFEEVTSPAPLHVVKRSPSPLQPLYEEPDRTYSLDENEEYLERPSRERSTNLEVLESMDELLSLEPPPIPPKSPARKFRMVSV